MTRQTRVAGVRKRRSWPRNSRRAAADGDGHRTTPQALDAFRAPEARNRPDGWRSSPAGQSNLAPGPMKTPSVRAQNVLKELAVELTGEQPPKGSWSPSRELLLALTAERLATARNCGPHTTREIIAWAQGCGVTIKPAVRPGGSLPEMWTRLIANAASGALTSTEIAGALQRSIRRRSVRIPIAFQIILVKILLSNFSDFE
ncbi:hypothetical protein [Bradyrhizobium sp. Ec3.3]|uniref:hypothetical protein n=1 Tax=Bradyrhizobium sp. Ec3.3 TaxID=189753 RepID=UPI0004800B5F|nr:hypothetical protein [Bradyrhizobium sp. Ec3.3]